MTLTALSLIAASLFAPANLTPPAAIVDLDHDGVADVISANPVTDTVTLTGAGGVVLRAFTKPTGEAAQLFGTAVRFVPDVTADGIPELAVLAPGASPQGAVDLFNPVTGARLWRSLGPVATTTADGWWFQNDVVSVDDQNDDGKPDILVEASPDGGGAKYTALLDGASGRLLAVRVNHPSDLLDLVVGGTRLYRATDTNDDGLVNSSDFAQFLDWLMNADARADVNNDGVIDTLDLTLMVNDLVNGSTTMIAGSGSGGGSGGSGGGNGGSLNGGSQAVTIAPGSCTSLWTSGESGYTPCTSSCTPLLVNPACNSGGTGDELFRYFSNFCDDSYTLITHRTGELTLHGILAELVRMHNEHDGVITSGSNLLTPLPCIPNDGIEWNDVLSFGWSTDQPLLVSTAVTNGGTTLQLTLAGNASSFAAVNVYFYIWVKDAQGDAHQCCFQIPFTVQPDCASVSMTAVDSTTTASPLICPGILVQEQPAVIGATFYPLGGVARWTVTYTIAGSPSQTLTNVGPTTIVAPPPGTSGVDVSVDYQYGQPYQCGPASASMHYSVSSDTDHDGIADTCETYLQTHGYPTLNPNSADSDSDGFPDGVEILLGSNPCSKTSIPDVTLDSDGDGLSDYEEVAIHHTDPHRADTDNDGADDFGEVELKRLGYPFDPCDAFSVTRTLGLPMVRDGYTAQWADFDRDGDHVFDLLEDMRGMRSDRVDIDGDGIPDGVELRSGLDPFKVDLGVGNGFGADDSDGDGLSDVLELRLGLNPHVQDSDGDGLSDGFEIVNGLDPLNGDSFGTGAIDPHADAILDSDGDGLSNLEESLHGTNPNSADSDGDGTSDLAEINNNGDPTDPSDNGQPIPESERGIVSLVVGDPHDPGFGGEMWELRVGSTTIRSRFFGDRNGEYFTFRRGRSYPFRLIYLGSNRNPHDFAWMAHIVPQCQYAIIDEPLPLLGEHWGSSEAPCLCNLCGCDPTSGRRGTLILPLIRGTSYIGPNMPGWVEISPLDAPVEWSLPVGYPFLVEPPGGHSWLNRRTPLASFTAGSQPGTVQLHATIPGSVSSSGFSLSANFDFDVRIVPFLPVNLRYAAFIPCEVIPAVAFGTTLSLENGVNLIGGFVAGDGRGFSPSATSYRALFEQRVRASDFVGLSTNEGTLSSNYQQAPPFGPSHAYDSTCGVSNGGTGLCTYGLVSGSVPAVTATATATASSHRTSWQRLGPDKFKIIYHLSGSLPLLIEAPAIDGDVGISVWQRIDPDTGQQRAEYSFVSIHDMFPAHEIYVNNVALEQFDPDAAGTNPLYLASPALIGNIWPGWAQPVMKSGAGVVPLGPSP